MVKPKAAALAAVAFLVAHSSGARASSLDELVAHAESGTFTDPAHPEAPFPYRLWRPPIVEPGKKYPLIVFLHGAGAQGDDNRKHLHSLVGTPLFDLGHRRARPAFVFAPQISEARAAWGPNNAGELQWPTHSVVKMVDWLARQHPVDESRLYLVGVSMGGRGVWGVLGAYPGKFAAAVPMTGPADLAIAPLLASAATSIWGFQNARDDVNPAFGPRAPGAKVNGARDMFAALEQAGARVVYTERRPRSLPRLEDRFVYTEYDADGHAVDKIAPFEPSLPRWLFAQRLASGPGPDGPELDVEALAAALARPPTGVAAAALAARARRFFGAEALASGAAFKIDGLRAAFAMEAPGAKSVRVLSVEQRRFDLALVPVGDTGVFAGVTAVPDGFAQRLSYDVDGRRRGLVQVEAYAPHPDAAPRTDVPHGRITHKRWKSKVFAGTERDLWLYVPAQARPAEPAAVMVFQDGERYVEWTPNVLDNLIARGDLPPMVGVYLSPGVFADGKRNRSFEYDTLSPQYARFLLEEILPDVEKTQKLSTDPAWRGLAGLSSGGICAFTAAWERPDQFGRVLSWIGSFTNIAAGKTLREGGHNYAALVRKTPAKPIRVFLQDGDQDLDNEHGSWPLANLELEKALAYARYDFRMVWGRGFHSPHHGLAILPDSLRWLYRDWKSAGR